MPINMCVHAVVVYTNNRITEMKKQKEKNNKQHRFEANDAALRECTAHIITNQKHKLTHSQSSKIVSVHRICITTAELKMTYVCIYTYYIMFNDTHYWPYARINIAAASRANFIQVFFFFSYARMCECIKCEVVLLCIVWPRPNVVAFFIMCIINFNLSVDYSIVISCSICDPYPAFVVM